MNGTKEDFASASAKDAVEERDADNADVDFVWVVRGFLTYYFPKHHGWRGEQDIILTVVPPEQN